MHQSLSIEPIRRARTKCPRVYQNARHAQRKRAQAGKPGPRNQAGSMPMEIMILLAIMELAIGLVLGPRVLGGFVGSKQKIAALAIDKYVHEAFPRWANANPDQVCPESLAALARYLSGKSLEDAALARYSNKKSLEDPWQRPYRMLCGANLPPEAEGFGVISDGPDQQPNTEDDIHSW
jgi:Type II secretion system (T2SS), protein G